jgi:hypothetical protein
MLIVAVASGACKGEKPLDEQQKHIQDVVAAGGVVDSILPIAVHLERFRQNLGPNPDTLQNASTSIDELVARWVKAIAANDTATLNLMLLSRAEFAWFYYPDSKMSKPPYEAPPELLWGQLLASSDEGARAMLKAFGGKRLAFKSVRCPDAPLIEAKNRLHEKCLTILQFKGIDQPEGTYFGTILERDGRFKFVGYTNRM